MTVYFGNAGVIDLATIRVMGVSVKTNENPIGYFGTGLKFAIATLLRTGHKIVLRAGGEKYRFGIREEVIRGETFQRVYMNDEPLPFTTDLGRNWEVWQAYRELHSNTLDERGEITNTPFSADTLFEVTGAEIQKCFNERHTIFVQGTPICGSADVDVYRGTSHYVYYRGVRAGVLPEPTAFTYNVKRSMELTEDRTIKSQWTLEWILSTCLPTIDCEELAVGIMKGGKSWDQNLAYNNSSHQSPAFRRVLSSRRSDANLAPALRRLVESNDQAEGVFPEVDPTADEISVFREAFAILEYMECDLDRYEVTLVETLGPNVMGLYHKGRDHIYVAREAVMQGDRFLAATLYEEWLHKRHRLEDETRSMQTYLINRLISYVVGEK